MYITGQSNYEINGKNTFQHKAQYSAVIIERKKASVFSNSYYISCINVGINPTLSSL